MLYRPPADAGRAWHEASDEAWAAAYAAVYAAARARNDTPAEADDSTA